MKKILSKNDVRYYCIKNIKFQLIAKKIFWKIKKISKYFTYIFFSNIDDYGLIWLEKSCNIENNSYQTLYNKLISIYRKKFLELDKINLINNFLNDIYNEYLN